MSEAGEHLQYIANLFGVSRQRIDQIVNEAQQRARQKVSDALANGRVVRPAKCERCEVDGVVEAHHPDYSQPLAVEWLCHPCHMVADIERRELDGQTRRSLSLVSVTVRITERHLAILQAVADREHKGSLHQLLRTIAAGLNEAARSTSTDAAA
ncbi:MAG: hypothetical protein M3R06_08320 [Chloroflexota bacterium]|nr:hypothetical protein [Chloroflexota bacterium]